MRGQGRKELLEFLSSTSIECDELSFGQETLEGEGLKKNCGQAKTVLERGGAPGPFPLKPPKMLRKLLKKIGRDSIKGPQKDEGVAVWSLEGGNEKKISSFRRPRERVEMWEHKSEKPFRGNFGVHAHGSRKRRKWGRNTRLVGKGKSRMGIKFFDVEEEKKTSNGEGESQGRIRLIKPKVTPPWQSRGGLERLERNTLQKKGLREFS